MKNRQIEVFDPPLCCPTGVCGTTVDPELARFASDLEWLKHQGIEVKRFNLSQEPAEFVNRPLVKETLNREGNKCLPLLIADGNIISQATYPSREMLSNYCGLAAPEKSGGDNPTPASSKCGDGKKAAGGKCC